MLLALVVLAVVVVYTLEASAAPVVLAVYNKAPAALVEHPTAAAPVA